MKIDRTDPQECGQMALETFTKGKPDDSAGFMSDCVVALAKQGALKKESVEADLLKWLQNPIVNIIACQNAVIQKAVQSWKAKKGAETLKAL